ncbi:NirA family protein [Paracraurococcus ruber]|uniref:Ferredoxin--nitrite reductase n=1 Tax=Paracraurococcus ruber TaxID=77675 RepID=A0ABS1D0B3_9PROT|nr:NirA family protein [Paracraurococcus ruber]MBK1660088.1 ferredoxin--nitrite reductase [Paracraurococcus ruber]TDG29952.1 NirA family protein [Paracraurococcus ruber]
MPQDGFSAEQQEYLKGFMAGVEARRGALRPAGAGEGGAPPDALRAAQDRVLAAGGKLVPQEQAKRERHPLDRWDELVSRAAEGRFPKPIDDFIGRYHGLFYVGPAQDAFMCRLRIPGGILSAWQLRGIAAIAEDCAGGYADVTTRANLQFREIPAGMGPEVVMRLGDLGLLPRGTGADNIRNITASPTAGIDPAELIDTRPIVRALHHHILNTRDLFGLPRKFNISLSGGGMVEVLQETNDISLTAGHTADGLRFALTLGGITGHRDFARETGVVVAPADVVPVCDAILRVFIAEGCRTDRAKARLKYVLDRMGVDGFLAAVEQRLGRPLERAAWTAPPPPAKHGHVGVHAQAQPGLRWIGVTTPVGRLTAARLRGLAEIAERFGSGTLRLTVWQNLLVSDIPAARVAEAQAAIAALGLGWAASAIRGGLVACTGNAGCKFAASNTKRHAAELADWLEPRITLDAPINIHLTGCHHSCAQHYVADIGLLGAKVEQGEDMVEGYDLHVGGGAGPEQKIGRLVRRVTAEELGPAVLALLQAWQRGRDAGESFSKWSARQPEAALAELGVLEDA